MDPRLVDQVASYADMLQIGSRSMQNFPLLTEIGKRDVPVLLKRGWSATLEEWLCAAEYVAIGGNRRIVLCERGVRTSCSWEHSRSVLDLNVIDPLRRATPLPIVADPSHATGDWRLVATMSQAAAAAGVDGLLIEVVESGVDRSKLRSDAEQGVPPELLTEIVASTRREESGAPSRPARSSSGVDALSILSKKSHYALHGVAYVACRSNGTPVPFDEILAYLEDCTAELALSPGYIAKIFQSVSRARLLEAVPGPSGGYRLAREADEIRLLDVVEALEGPLVAGRCPARPGRTLRRARLRRRRGDPGGRDRVPQAARGAIRRGGRRTDSPAPAVDPARPPRAILTPRP